VNLLWVVQADVVSQQQVQEEEWQGTQGSEFQDCNGVMSMTKYDG